MKKISVVVINNSDKESFERCINSIINQSYKNLEILIVDTNKNDYNYLDDDRIKIVTAENNLNIHDYRFLAFKNCTGDYVSFINANDYVSCDYYRLLIDDVTKNDADMAISSYVDMKKNCVYNFINIDDSYSENDILDEFFATEGKNDRWFLLGLKLVSKKIVDKILDDYKKENIESIVEDDILISTLLFSHTKKLIFCSLAEYYLFSKEIITGVLKKNIFSEEIYQKYKKDIDNWSISKENSTYYLSKSEYNDGLEQIKKKIINNNIKVISFDMFDTLVVRPFFVPLDMFVLMDKKFVDITKCNPVVKFSKIRVEAEEELRRNNIEITLSQIYDYISEFYSIDRKKMEKLKNIEEKMELHFCTKRKTGYQLYSLAKSLKKKVIITSDIYLSKAIIEQILKNNNYEFDHIYLSSELMKTKSRGSLYEHILAAEKTRDILHIGDNEHSDIEVAKTKGLEVCYLPRTINVMMNATSINVNSCGYLNEDFDMYNINTNIYLKNYGVRCAMAVVANKYFDNPFRTFMENTKFNSDPTFIGYFCLGMHLLALSNWILSDTKNKGIDSISFMSRDGYLPLKATKIFNNNTNLNNQLLINYIYVSRRSLMPLVFSKKESASVIDTYIDYDLFSPETIIKQFGVIINENNIKKYKDALAKNNIIYNKKFSDKLEFHKCLSIVYDTLFDLKKYNNYLKMVKEYFNENFVGNAATFDIGYSGKPESIISNIIGRPINTYFFHSTSSDAYNNSYISDCKLNTFYDFMPTLTGTIRELFYSDYNPSSIGYKFENGKVVPIFAGAEKYTNFNKNMLECVQKYALKFVDDFSNIFSEYVNALDLNKFYFSIPYEYFCHYASKNDRLLFTDLIFESNVNDSNQLNYYIDIILDNYKHYNHDRYSKKINTEIGKILPELEKTTRENIIKEGYGKLPKSKINRFIYYILFDRKKISEKFTKEKK